MLANQITKITILFWDMLHDALDGAAFQALQADTSAAVIMLSCNTAVTILHGVTYYLFQANSNDPATLGIVLAWALNLANTYYNQMGKPPGGWYWPPRSYSHVRCLL